MVCYLRFLAPEGVVTMSNLQNWVNTERFTAFPLVAGANINEIAESGKILVMMVFDSDGAERQALSQR